MFGYISVLGGSFSMETITENVAQSLEDGIKKMLNLYPDGTVTVSSNAIVLPDVFTFLINLTNMTNASADQLASRLRGFGLHWPNRCDIICAPALRGGITDVS